MREMPHKYDWDKIRKDYAEGMSTTEVSKKYGCCLSTVNRIVVLAGICRTSSESLLFKSGGWRKLVRVNHKSTRLLSLPAEIISALGFDVDNSLMAKWEIKRGKLILKIKKTEKER